MTAIQTTASSYDRLSFTLFLSLAVHSLVIFGVTFSPNKPSVDAPSIAVTIATHKSKQAPEKVDFLAQYNQQASGTEKEARELTADSNPDFADTRIQSVNSPPQYQTSPQKKLPYRQVISTRDSDRLHVNLIGIVDEANKNNTNEQKMMPAINDEIASLRATLDRQRQEYAKRPRKRALTSVSAKSAVDAAYLHRWTRKIEEIGNRNFPNEAVRNNITGSLRLLCVLNANGAIQEVKILQTSGHPILDTASLQIIHLAAPFLPFPPEIRKNTDQLEIIRTWHFEVNGLTTTQ